jgi:hypothetical protein
VAFIQKVLWQMCHRNALSAISSKKMMPTFLYSLKPDGILFLESSEISGLQLVETILQQSSTPPCAIIDDACNVVFIHGRTGRYLEPAEGKASVNILEMARVGLKSHLASAIRKVAMHQQEILLRAALETFKLTMVMASCISTCQLNRYSNKQ